jgi:hypothetical protein
MAKYSFETPALYYHFNETLAKLRKELKPLFPVTVELTNKLGRKNTLGYCKLEDTGKGYKFVIRIRASLPEDLASVILMHEWGHAISWDFGETKIPHHAPEWGVALSRVWRSVTDERIDGY